MQQCSLATQSIANEADASLFKAILFNENHSFDRPFRNRNFFRDRPHKFNLPYKDSQHLISGVLIFNSCQASTLNRPIISLNT